MFKISKDSIECISREFSTVVHKNYRAVAKCFVRGDGFYNAFNAVAFIDTFAPEYVDNIESEKKENIADSEGELKNLNIVMMKDMKIKYNLFFSKISTASV